MLGDNLARLELQGTRACASVEPLAGDAWLYESTHDTITLALALSAQVGGQVWWSNSGLTWVRGRATQYAVRADALGDVLRARAVCESVGADPAWSVGACARALLAFVGRGGTFSEHAKRAVAGRWHYYRVRVATGEQGELWDIDSAYYQLLCRAPSPFPVFISPDRWLWAWGTSEQMERWARVLIGVGAEKVLRNAIVGCALGADGSTVCACKGELLRVKPRGTGWVGIGALVVRTLYELTGAGASETQAVYSNTDCVLVPERTQQPPRVWRDAGLACSLRATGAYDVRGVGVYRIGTHATKPYQTASTRQPAPLPEMSSAWQWEIARPWLHWLSA
jgi:hypothetical protein